MFLGKAFEIGGRLYFLLTFCLLEEGDYKNGVADRRRLAKGFEFRWNDVLSDSVEMTN